MAILLAFASCFKLHNKASVAARDRGQVWSGLNVHKTANNNNGLERLHNRWGSARARTWGHLAGPSSPRPPPPTGPSGQEFGRAPERAAACARDEMHALEGVARRISRRVWPGPDSKGAPARPTARPARSEAPQGSPRRGPSPVSVSACSRARPDLVGAHPSARRAATEARAPRLVGAPARVNRPRQRRGSPHGLEGAARHGLRPRIDFRAAHIIPRAGLIRRPAGSSLSPAPAPVWLESRRTLAPRQVSLFHLSLTTNNNERPGQLGASLAPGAPASGQLIQSLLRTSPG